VVKEYVPGKSSRACFSVDWNPQIHNLIAAGYDKGKENSVAVWDTNHGSPVLSFASRPSSLIGSPSKSVAGMYVDMNEHATDGGRREKDSSGPHSVKPAYDLQSGEAAVSLAWVPFDPLSLVVGTGARWLRIYDLRDSANLKAGLAHASKPIAGLRFDPFVQYRLLSFADDGLIKLWDVRRLDAAMGTLQVPSMSGSGGLIQCEWSPTVTGEFSTLSKDDVVLRLWSVTDTLIKTTHPHASRTLYLPQHESLLQGMSSGTQNGNSGGPTTISSSTSQTNLATTDKEATAELQAQALNALLQGVGINTGMSSYMMGSVQKWTLLGFTYHQGLKDTFVTISSDGFLQSTVARHAPAFAVSPTNHLAFFCNDDSQRAVFGKLVCDDIAERMRLRAQMGYGTDVSKNVDVSTQLQERALAWVWSWIDRLRRLSVDDSAPSQTQPQGSQPAASVTTQGQSLNVVAIAVYPGVLQLFSPAYSNSLGSVTSVTSASSSAGSADALPLPVARISDELDKRCRIMLRKPLSERRNVALQLCGLIGPSHVTMPSSDLNKNDQLATEKAVARAMFVHDHARALRTLQLAVDAQLYSLETRQLFQFASLAVASYNREDRASWKVRMVDPVRPFLKASPYISAALAFLTEDRIVIDSLLRDSNLDLVDRVSIAVLTLQDSDLLTFLQEAREKCLLHGSASCIEGLLLTGLGYGNNSCLELLGTYVDATADVQSAIAMVLQLPKSSSQVLVFPSMIPSAPATPSSAATSSAGGPMGVSPIEPLSSTSVHSRSSSTASGTSFNKAHPQGTDSPSAGVAFSPSPGSYSAQRVRWLEWLEAYRDLLDQWQLWQLRCDFDAQLPGFWSRHGKVLSAAGVTPLPSDGPFVHLACAFCGASLLQSAPGAAGKAAQGPQTWGRTAPAQRKEQRASFCASCQKSLSRCAVCGITYGLPASCTGELGASSASSASSTTRSDKPGNKGSFMRSTASQRSASSSVSGGASDDLAPESWFAWCQRCKHGGHVKHLAEWFASQSVCPVKDCDCHCMALDHMS
jgi:hypothetical protein